MGMVRTDLGFLLVQNAARLSGGSAVPKKDRLSRLCSHGKRINFRVWNACRGRSRRVRSATRIFLVDTAESGPF